MESMPCWMSRWTGRACSSGPRTHLLVIHELRRYVRIPVVSQAEIDTGNRVPASATTVEVSSGGISVRLPPSCLSLILSGLSWNLPGIEKLSVRAFICWYRETDKVYGLRFDSSDERRLKVRRLDRPISGNRVTLGRSSV